MHRVFDVSAKQELTLLPSCAMAFWTFLNLVRLVHGRVRSLQKREVNMKYYKTYSEGDGEPVKLALLSQHVENLFEVPPLFHVVVIAIYVTKLGTTTTVALSWIYVLLRVLHSVIHTGYNNVLHRFYSFIASNFVLITLWGNLSYNILMKE